MWTTLLSPKGLPFGAVIMRPLRSERYGVKFYRNEGGAPGRTKGRVIPHSGARVGQGTIALR